jgi:methylmalonyl-CoA/ethylmalonyl-CoA epimerase
MHHVGLVVADVATESAEYEKRFGYILRSGIIHDPVQTAFVQFLQLKDDPVLLELVAPDSPGSKLSNALAKGGGVNHVCYETPDIEAACAEMRSNGCGILHTPTPAVAFNGRRIAWLMARERVIIELVERPAGTDPQEL